MARMFKPMAITGTEPCVWSYPTHSLLFHLHPRHLLFDKQQLLCPSRSLQENRRSKNGRGLVGLASGISPRRPFLALWSKKVIYRRVHDLNQGLTFVKKHLGVTMGVRRNSSTGERSTFCLSFSGWWYAMLMDVHKTLYPFYTNKKIPHVTATVTRNAFRWQ